MRKVLPLLLLLSACDAHSPMMPASDAIDNSSFQQLQNISSAPESVVRYAESESSQGKLELWEWQRLIGGAAEAGNQMLFTRLAAVAPKVQNADLKNLRAEILFRAAGVGQTQFLEWLLTDPQWQNIGFNLNQDTGTYQGSALTQAIKARKTETVDWLLAKGADPKQVLKNNETALTAAVDSGERSLIDKFLALGLSLNSDQGMPPLFIAVRNNDKAMVQYLLDKGANLHATWIEPSEAQIIGAKPISVLNVAIRNDYDNQMLKFLLDKGATPDRPEHASAVATFIENRYYSDPGELEPGVQQAFDLLLKYKPNLRAANNYGETALGLAVKRGQVKSLTEMIAAGADLNLSDDDGKTLLMYAAESGSLVMAQFLLYRGADIKAKDLRGQRALDYASDASMRNYLSSIPTR